MKRVFILYIILLFINSSCLSQVDNRYIGYWNVEYTELNFPRISGLYFPPMEIVEKHDKLIGYIDSIEWLFTYNKADNSMDVSYSNVLEQYGVSKSTISQDGRLIRIGSSKKSTLQLLKISKEEFENEKLNYQLYLTPDFFIGEWKEATGNAEHNFEIIKENDDFLHISKYGKESLTYDHEQKVMRFTSRPDELRFSRTGKKNEIMVSDFLQEMKFIKAR